MLSLKSISATIEGTKIANSVDASTDGKLKAELLWQFGSEENLRTAAISAYYEQKVDASMKSTERPKAAGQSVQAKKEREERVRQEVAHAYEEGLRILASKYKKS